jgi:large subunit ribosomal protein L9
MAVELILRADVPALGKVGDLVRVEPGYARNYLLPRGLAMKVSPENLLRFEAEKKKAVKLEELRQAELREMTSKIASISATVTARANEEGHLYGSVDERQIAEAIGREGFEIDPRWVGLEAPIKELGVYTVPIRLGADLETEIKVWVVEDKDDVDSADAPGADQAPEDEPTTTD